MTTLAPYDKLGKRYLGKIQLVCFYIYLKNCMTITGQDFKLLWCLKFWHTT